MIALIDRHEEKEHGRHILTNPAQEWIHPCIHKMLPLEKLIITKINLILCFLISYTSYLPFNSFQFHHSSWKNPMFSPCTTHHFSIQDSFLFWTQHIYSSMLFLTLGCLARLCHFSIFKVFNSCAFIELCMCLNLTSSTIVHFWKQLYLIPIRITCLEVTNNY